MPFTLKPMRKRGAPVPQKNAQIVLVMTASSFFHVAILLKTTSHIQS